MKIDILFLVCAPYTPYTPHSPMHLGRRAVEVYAYYRAYPFDLSFVDCVFKDNSQYAILQVSEEEKMWPGQILVVHAHAPPRPFL